MKYLVVAAHADDEVLGAGATMHMLARKGHEVDVCILSSASHTREEENKIKTSLENSCQIIGVKKLFIRNGEAETFKDQSHREIIEFIENAIKDVQPDYIITHHPSDLHNDHYVTSKICQEAARLPLRRITKVKDIKGIYFMEVQTSTDWALDKTMNCFRADTYFPVEKEDVEAKIKALSQYENVMRDYPYPRSSEGIYALVQYRGTLCGQKYAEAFETAFRIEV